MLGLLASHADKQLPILNQLQLQRYRQQQPRPIMSFAAAANALHPAQQRPPIQENELYVRPTCSGVEDDGPLASPLVSFLGRKSKRGSPRLPDNVTSPRSVWEETPHERLDPTASPRQTVTSSRHVSPPPTTSSRRIQSLLSPDRSASSRPTSAVSTVKAPAVAPRKRSTPPPSPPQIQVNVAESAAKRPRLVRRVSSQWRQELAPRDRAKTRERIMRSLHAQCQGDLEALVLLLSAMDEELLHIKTTSSEYYTQQALALSDQIEHATLER
ncbi:hypothetical protein BBJ28_00014737 [Nothophytophthora sp. Chile5]|nr:hypothetical protein BBJ28_00014737 [Nothophytophthora sp. Chile5]